jgi:hypothetical protein
MKILSQIFAAAVILIFVFSGCAYNPGSTNPGPGNTIPPKAGTVYIYNNTPIDTNGHPMPDSAYTTVDSIAATGTTYSTKTNVTQVSIRNLKTGLVTTSYVNYETNGDISEYVGGSFLAALGITYPDWVTYPMQSHTNSGSTVADTTINLPFGPVTVPLHMVVTDSIDYVNWTNFPLNQSSLDVVNLKHQTDYNGTLTIIPGLPGTKIGTTGMTTIAFAPSIGYYADHTTKPLIIPQGLFPSINGLETTIVSYNLK